MGQKHLGEFGSNCSEQQFKQPALSTSEQKVSHCVSQASRVEGMSGHMYAVHGHSPPSGRGELDTAQSACRVKDPVAAASAMETRYGAIAEPMRPNRFDRIVCSFRACCC